MIYLKDKNVKKKLLALYLLFKEIDIWIGSLVRSFLVSYNYAYCGMDWS
jgi:hypothetical protein